jgi:DNA polymerase
MTTEEYVRDPRFKAWGLCYKEVGTDEIPVWVRGDRIRRWAVSIDWSRTAILAHNAQFDVTILSWVYGVKPAFIFDTLSMARALRGVEVGNSLATLAEAFELPPKGKAVHSTDGMLDSIPFHVEQELADYCRHDTHLCEQIFLRLIEGYPTKELKLIDMTLKMYTNPLLTLDKEMLAQAIDEERIAREGLLQRLGMVEATLASNPQFAQALKALGVNPPTKTSKTTGEETLALAKNDAHFQALLNHENEDVALLCEARLKVKSTSERTRAQRFLEIAERGSLPVPLSYYGAATGRWTAAKGSAINMQNLKRGSFLRKAIMAPEGYVIAVGDLSQIEPRVLAWLADYDNLLDIFRSGGDPYAQFGAQMFNLPGMTKDSNPVERQSAKSALLGAGYQLGWASFAAQLLTGFLGAAPKRYSKEEAKQLGVTGAEVQKFLSWDENIKKMEEIPHTCTELELGIHCLAAKAIIDKYRAASAPVVAFWELMGQLIEHSLYKGKEYTHKCLTFRKGEIVLPSGMSVRYPDLRPDQDEKGRVQWSYADGKDGKRTKLYAGKVTNNVVQGTARCVMTDGMLRIGKRYPVCGTVHDEALCVAPESEADEAKEYLLACMTIEPTYMPGIPLAADGGVHKRYGLAKG